MDEREMGWEITGRDSHPRWSWEFVPFRSCPAPRREFGSVHRPLALSCPFCSALQVASLALLHLGCRARKGSVHTPDAEAPRRADRFLSGPMYTKSVVHTRRDAARTSACDPPQLHKNIAHVKSTKTPLPRGKETEPNRNF